jgi:SAM-dependent methyltransferase
MGSFFRSQLEDWLKTIKVYGKVIDVGGSQNPMSKSRSREWNVIEHKILDLPKPHENSKAPDIAVDLNYYQEFHEDFGDIEYHFDTAFCLEVMEYLWDPLTALRNINRLLIKGGFLYISIPFLYPEHPPKGKDLMRYTRHGAKKLLEKASFEVIDIKPRYALNGGNLIDFWQKDGYRYDRDLSYNELTETGYLIKAKSI